MNQERKPHFESLMAKLENFREEEIRVLQGYLEPVLEVREKILSSFSNEKASSRFSVGEISDELMYVNLLEDLLLLRFQQLFGMFPILLVFQHTNILETTLDRIR